MDLNDIPALAHLTPSQLENLHQVGEQRELSAGEELIRRGDEGGKLYFLLEGTVEVYVEEGGSEIQLNQVEAPAILGELEMLTGRGRTASVRFVSPGRTLALRYTDIQERIDAGDPAVLQVMYGLARVIANRLVSTTAKLVDLESKADPIGASELKKFRQKLFSDWTV